jgi:copper chaperone NosL
MKKNKNEILPATKIMLVLCAIALVVVLFVPMWRIDLDAPQYPEGLRMLIYTNGLGGDVNIINGLNHYIGMKTLHKEDFIEFTVLPYIISAYAILFVITALLNRKRFFYILFGLFVAFGVLAMTDFWRWEYNYGHHLDPNAAIIVPGMAYQPPLIGYKQLLNFAAYSIPDVGGWLFIAVGAIMLILLFIEVFKHKAQK